MPHRPTHLTPLQAQKAMRLNVVASTLDAVFIALATGTFLTGYALLLHADDVTIGFLGAFPLLTMPAAAFSSYIADRYRIRKALWLVSAWAIRLTVLLYLLIPVLVPKYAWGTRLSLLLFGVFLNSLFMAASGPVWMAWMSDIIPQRVEGRFWGRRNSLVNLSLLVASVIASFFIDWIGRDRLEGFVAVFGIAVLFGSAMTVLHYRIPEPRPEGPPHTAGFLQTFAGAFRNGTFVRYLIFACAFNFACWVMIPFIAVFFIQELKLSYTWIAIIGGVNTLGSVVSSRFWGYLVDRYGPKPVLSLCTYLKPLAPLSLVIATPTNFTYTLTILWLFDGFLNAGQMVSTIPLAIGLGPREQRSAYLAVLNAVAGVVAAAAPILGGYFLAATAGFEGWLVVPISNLKLLFLLSAVLRTATLPLLNVVRDRKGAPTGAFLRQFVAGNPFRVVRYSQILAHSPDEAERLKATKALGGTGSSIATGELVKALDDPSLDVREEAAAALGEIADTAAIEPLVERMRSPEFKIQAQSARALGKIPHRRSLEALIEALPTADRELRKDVVRALGEIGDPDASEHLMQLLVVEKEPGYDRDRRRGARQDRRDPGHPLPAAPTAAGQERDRQTPARQCARQPARRRRRVLHRAHQGDRRRGTGGGTRHPCLPARAQDPLRRRDPVQHRRGDPRKGPPRRDERAPRRGARTVSSAPVEQGGRAARGLLHAAAARRRAPRARPGCARHRGRSAPVRRDDQGAVRTRAAPERRFLVHLRADQQAVRAGQPDRPDRGPARLLRVPLRLLRAAQVEPASRHAAGPLSTGPPAALVGLVATKASGGSAAG